MIQTFKIWISSLLCLGIFVAFLELIIPKSKFKKYIYALVGILVVITIVSPIVNIYKSKDVSSSIDQVTKAMSSSIDQNQVSKTDVEQKQQELVKSEFIESIKKDATDKLTLRGINVLNVDINLDDDYNISKMTITIQKIDTNKSSIASVNKVVNYINQEYDIDYSKIFVNEKGE